MKAKVLLIFSFAVVLCSCDRSNNPSPDPDSAVNAQLAIIKLSQEMQGRIFVSPIVDSIVVDYQNPVPNLNTLYYSDKLVLFNPTKQDSLLAEFAQSKLKLVGTNPYILLQNGYAIIDWKWMNFQPLSGAFRRVLYSSPQIYSHKRAQESYSTNFYYLNGSLENEKYYLLYVQWHELTDLASIWGLSAGEQIDKPEIRYINLKDIEGYGAYQKSFQTLYPYFEDLLSLYNIFAQNETTFDQYVEDLDKMQSAYVQTLNQMINNNDFETWSRVYK